MSINPARTVAAAVPSGVWTSGWVYFAAPILGMILAAQVSRAVSHPTHLACPKLHHGNAHRCIYRGHPGSQSQ
jgi:aquaporin Z